jgi:hypothetical protein
MPPHCGPHNRGTGCNTFVLVESARHGVNYLNTQQTLSLTGSIEILRQSRMPQKICFRATADSCEQGAGALCRRRLVLLGRVRASVREMISDIDAEQYELEIVN